MKLKIFIIMNDYIDYIMNILTYSIINLNK